MFRSSLCRAPKKVLTKSQSVRYYAGSHSHADAHGHKGDSHGKVDDAHGHKVDSHGHDGHGHDGHGDHGPVPLKLQEWTAPHIQESAVVTTTLRDSLQKIEGPSDKETVLTALESSGALDHFNKTYSILDDKEEGDDWLSQLIGSKTVIQSLAQINTTELSFDINKVKPQELIAKYQEELENFEKVTLPALKSEGVPKRIIHHLHALYKLRPKVTLEHLELTLSRFRVVLSRMPKEARNERVVTGTRTVYWEKRFQVSTVGFYEWRRRYPNEETLMSRSARHLLGWKALTEAFTRGFTDEEYNYLNKVLANTHFSTELLNSLNADAAEIKYLVVHDQPKGKEAITKFLAKYPPKSAERRHVLDYLTDTETSTSSLVNGVYEKSPMVHPYHSKALGETPFNLPSLLSAVDAGISAESKNSEKVSLLTQVKEAISEIFTVVPPRDLEILDRVRLAVELSPRQLDELYVPFLQDYKTDIPESVLVDAINPNPLAAKLWGDTLLVRSWEEVKYQRDYFDFTGNMLSDFDSPEIQKQYAAVTENGKYEHLVEVAPIICGFDDIYHAKLIRLAGEYFNFDLQSDVGQIQFDLFLHAYDVSPGEATLERVHVYPTPIHTYEELPVIKFDGYEESDDPEVYALATHKSASH